MVRPSGLPDRRDPVVLTDNHGAGDVDAWRHSAQLANIADGDTACALIVSYGLDKAMAAQSEETAFKAIDSQAAAQRQTVSGSSVDDGAYGN